MSKASRTLRTRVMATLFALFTEVECDLISERMREGFAKAGASGMTPGRPKGPPGVARLDGRGMKNASSLNSAIPGAQ